MECISKFVKGYKCFHLTKDNVNEFIFWINNTTNMNYKIKRKTYEYIYIYDSDYEFFDYKFYFNKDEWIVYKKYDILTYNNDEFNNLYEIKEN